MDRGLARVGQGERIWFFEKHGFCQSSSDAVKNPAFC